MSEILDIDVIAPDIPTDIKDLTARVVDKTITIDAKYNDYDSKQVYTAGDKKG